MYIDPAMLPLDEPRVAPEALEPVVDPEPPLAEPPPAELPLVDPDAPLDPDVLLPVEPLAPAPDEPEPLPDPIEAFVNM